METFRRPVIYAHALVYAQFKLATILFGLQPTCAFEFSKPATVSSEWPSLLNVMQCNGYVVDASGHIQLWQNFLFSLFSVGFRRTRACMVYQSCSGLGSRQLEDATKPVRDNRIVWAELQIIFSHVTKWHINSHTHTSVLYIDCNPRFTAIPDWNGSMTDKDRKVSS